MTHADERAESESATDKDSDVLPELRDFPTVLRTDEVARIFRMDPTHVATLLRKGDLPGFKVGGEWRCLRSALQEFILAGGNRPEPMKE